MGGLDLTVDGAVLEMRAHGVRNTKNGPDGARLFTLMENEHIQGILFDSRQADYQFTPLETLERARLVARMSRGRAVAHIVRKDQEDQIDNFLLIHREMGSECKAFRAYSEARAWLNAVISTGE